MKLFTDITILFFQSFTLFWKRNPALWVALSLFLGLCAQFITYLSIIPFLFVVLFLSHKEKIFSLILFIIAILWAQNHYAFPKQGSEGKAIFTISSYTKAKFGGFYYHGTLHTFTPEHESLLNTHLPCRIFSETLYDPDYEYIIFGHIQRKPNRAFVSIKSNQPWVKTKKIFNLVQKRTIQKKKIMHFFHKNLETKVASFLSALVTGESQDDIQRQVFSKLGLAHLFAISGFHFSLFAFAFHFFLRLFLPPKMEAFCLIVILSLFLAFLGLSPSVMRAWFTAAFALCALLIEQEKRSLNTFGLSLFFVIIINPYVINDLSFQLSFLATVGILLFTSSFDNLLQFFFPKEPTNKVLRRNLQGQYLYILTSWFRKILALNFAVHLVLFPVQVAIFSKFPWHSLIYNLFFPFLVSISLILLLIASCITLVCPWIGEGCFYITNEYTRAILWITEYPPFPQKNWYIETTFPSFTPLCLTGIFILGILWQYYWEQKRCQTENILRFI